MGVAGVLDVIIRLLGVVFDDISGIGKIFRYWYRM